MIHKCIFCHLHIANVLINFQDRSVLEFRILSQIFDTIFGLHRPLKDNLTALNPFVVTLVGEQMLTASNYPPN